METVTALAGALVAALIIPLRALAADAARRPAKANPEGRQGSADTSQPARSYAPRS